MQETRVACCSGYKKPDSDSAGEHGKRTLVGAFKQVVHVAQLFISPAYYAIINTIRILLWRIPTLVSLGHG